MVMERLRELYEDLTDEEIEKAMQKVAYVLYDSVSGEIIQTGDTDLLAYERMEPYRENMAKTIIPKGEEWMLRGEFVDHAQGKHMIKVEEGALVAKETHVEAITEMRMPRDGAKKKPIEVDGIGGREIIGFETVQDPLRVEKVKEIIDIKRK